MCFWFFRCDIVNLTKSTNEFLQDFNKDLPDVLKHDYIAKSQARYFNEVKSTLVEGEFVVTLDFAENYTCHVQDAVQSYHWSSKQATLHPYVIYYNKNNKIKHRSYVVISEKVLHDTSSVHLFNEKMISYLKQTFGSEKVKKIIYFSDGAASQYKNKSNFINLAFHEEDFKVKVEWNFFATSHGKGACDGIGGTVKRNAYKASMQKVNTQHITSAKNLFDWAVTFFKKIEFSFCTSEEHELHDFLLEERYALAKTIPCTRQYHYYCPIDKTSLSCKFLSHDTVSYTKGLLKKTRK